MKHPRYQDYVIKDGRLVGQFDEMYRDVEDPWGCVSEAASLQNRLFLEVVRECGPCDRVLDVGCGLGPLTESIRLASAAPKADAFDISEAAIGKAQSAFPEIRFLVHDLLRDGALPHDSGTFDLITASEVTWYLLPGLGEVLKELRRCQHPDGFLLMKQSFLPPGVQEYGLDVVASPEDLLAHLVEAGFEQKQEIRLGKPNGEVVSIISCQIARP